MFAVAWSDITTAAAEGAAPASAPAETAHTSKSNRMATPRNESRGV
jgi:hypothetical protein